MAKIIAVAQQKGGAGKTTLVAHLAAALAVRGRVAVLDIDPQKSLARWHALRAASSKAAAPIQLIDISGWRLAQALDRARDAHDLILIDTPPQIGTDSRIAIRGADLVLLPLQPSPPDLWAAEGTLRLAIEEKRPVALAFNRAPARSRLRSLMEVELRGRALRLLRTSLGNRAGFATAFAQGLGITEASASSAGALELTALAEEITALLG
jgi:chromosome partitioning protein